MADVDLSSGLSRLEQKRSRNREYMRQKASKYRSDPESRENYLHTQRNYKKKQRIKDPIKLLFWAARVRAKKFKLPFTIEIADLHCPALCPLLEIPIIVGDGARNANSPSIDKIDNSKGYIKGNVQIISWRANELKRDGTLEEFKLMIKNWEKQ